MNAIRKAFVAGQFYPGAREGLLETVKACMDRAKPSSGPVPKALIAPHAGYVYSGDVAASAYARILPHADQIKRVVLLGPCHRVPVHGLAVSGADEFETPLGLVPVDTEARKLALSLAQVQVFDQTHAQEHSLEVHLPFLQVLLGDDFTLVPFVVGDTSPEEVAAVLELLWGGPETLIVISSDLSHFLDYDRARRLDGDTCKAIEQLDYNSIGRDQACGRNPIKGLLKLARDRGMSVETIDVRSSGDTAGSKDRVVGYGAWVFCEPDKPASTGTTDDTGKAEKTDFRDATRKLLESHGKALLMSAIKSIDNGLRSGKPALIDMQRTPADVQALGACFVTLKKNGQLRGCIGSPEAHRPLGIDVIENAWAAAFRDPRFPALSAEEWPELSLSISVLSPQVPMTILGEEDLINQLRPTEDGLVIRDGPRKALFLPSVWEQLPDPRQFLAHLKAKAGMAADHWSDEFQAFRFIAVEVKTNQLPARD